MSAAASPNSRSVKLGAEPKRVAILVFFLAVAVFLWWHNSQDNDIPKSSNASPAATHPVEQALPIAEPASPSASARKSRRGARNPDRNTLEMRPIDATQGNIDPTLRLELLERLSTVKPAGLARSLFEVGTAPVAPLTGKTGRDTIIKVADRKPQKPPDPMAVTRESKPPVMPIALKFYGFARPKNPSEPKRGFFLDGDVILVAAEGDIVKSHYKIVKLQDHSAIVEDTVDKNQQTLVLTPEGRGDL